MHLLYEFRNDKKEAHHIYLNVRNVSDQNWINFVELQKAKCTDATLTPIIIVDQFEFRCNEPLINQKNWSYLKLFSAHQWLERIVMSMLFQMCIRAYFPWMQQN